MKKIVLMVMLAYSSLALSTSADLKLVTLLTHFHSYHALFSEKTYLRGRIQQTAQGKIWIQRPGQFRWQVNKPWPQLLVVNHQVIWTYDPKLKQASRQVWNKKQNLGAAFLLTGNVHSLTKQFRVNVLEHNQKRQTYRLIPRDQSVFRSIDLVFDRDVLVSLNTQNALGQLTVFSFSQIQYNPTIAPQIFQFHPPKGVEVLR